LPKPKTPLAVRLEYFAAAAMLGTLRKLPRGLAYTLANWLTAFLDAAVPKLGRVAERNLTLAMPELDAAQRAKVVDGIFQSIARMLVLFAKFPDIHRENVGQWIRYEGLENYENAKQKGRGVLVATAHLGNWEFSAFAHALMTEPMHVMVRPLDNPLVDELVETRRQLSGNTLIVKKDSALTVLRALRKNTAVGILIDQNTTPEEGVFVEFFGIRACANAAFTRLASRTGAAVVPGFAFWEEREKKYVLRFYPEVPMTGDTQADTQRIHSLFESLIRQYPEQWLWIHRRWKTRPPGEPSLY
jgi:Kdo2-lipid IVA lauroyltransferase/acyltransferase